MGQLGRVVTVSEQDGGYEEDVLEVRHEEEDGYDGGGRRYDSDGLSISDGSDASW